MKNIKFWNLLIIATASTWFSVAAFADGNAPPYYAGKTIKIVVGSGTGGGFDGISRIFAQYLPAHVTGQPLVIVQNMPGGSSLKAANYIYNAAPDDGTYLGVFEHALILQTVVDPRSTQFDMAKYNWIGRMAIDDLVGVVWRASGIRSIEDVKKKEVIIGADSGNSTSSMVPHALNHLIGTKFKAVSGYNGLSERFLAMERGEIDGVGGASWTAIAVTQPEWVKDQKLVLLYQNALERNPKFPDLPTIAELAQNEDDSKILRLLGLTETVGKSMAFGPRVSSDHVAEIRKAFSDTMADPRFSEDAKKRGLIPSELSGEKLQALFESFSSSMTNAFMERFKKVIAE